MQSLNDEERREVLGEVFMDELRAIHEYVREIPDLKQRLVRVEDDVKDLKSDMKVVKAVAADHNQMLNDHRKQLRDHDKLLIEHGHLLTGHTRILSRIERSFKKTLSPA